MKTQKSPKNLWKAAAFYALFLAILGIDHAMANPPAGYTLVWSDEFNGLVGSAPNTANWTYDTGANGWGNNELENYTNSTANSQIVFDSNATDGSALAIIAKIAAGHTNDGQVGSYTSARLRSSASGFPGQSFQYGWLEARIQLPGPNALGLWPAFWMLGMDFNSGTHWPACGETDIMEFEQQYFVNGNQISGTVHYPNTFKSTVYNFPSGQYVYSAYHTYSILWTQSQIQCYVDNNLYATYNPGDVGITSTLWNTTFDQPFFFILNDAVGGNLGGPVSPSTSFPATMLVDYVRVYKQLTPTPTYTPTPCVTCIPTATPTPTPQPGVPPFLYPNPSRGGAVSIHVPSQSSVSDIKVRVFTLGYRKVLEQVFSKVSPGTDVSINMTDNWNNPLANGLYYALVETNQGQSILKLLVLR